MTPTAFAALPEARLVRLDVRDAIRRGEEPLTTIMAAVRGLEPPQPMVAMLERLEILGPGETLGVVHDRRPTFLYPQLDERGFTHETDEPEPGVVRIRIRRPAP